MLVAHSTGATVALACLLGEDDGQGVDRVVFTGANLGPAPSDRKTKSMLTSRVGKFLTYLKPVVKKKLREGKPVDVVNEHYWENGFYLSSIPTNAVREMWLCMDEILEEEEKLLHSRVKRVALINGGGSASGGRASESSREILRNPLVLALRRVRQVRLPDKRSCKRCVVKDWLYGAL